MRSLPQSLEKPLSRDDVSIEIRREVFIPGKAHPWLSCQVDHYVDIEKDRRGVCRSKILLKECERRVVECTFDVCTLCGWGVVVSERVNATHDMTVPKESFCERAAYESRDSSYEDCQPAEPFRELFTRRSLSTH